MPQPDYPTVMQAGDSGVMVLFGDSLDMAINNAAHAFDAALRVQNWTGVEEVSPAIRSVLVRYDPLRIGADALKDKIIDLLSSRSWLKVEPDPNRRIWKLPAHYGEGSGPDIENVARQLGKSVEETIEEHSQSKLTVLMLGFAPGCAYLGSLPKRWDLPRLDFVKPEVPPGSLSVAVRQTVLFATPIPTGWQTIARTPFLSFSRCTEPFFYLAPGDEITFESIDFKTFKDLSREVQRGKKIVNPESPN
ncbi:MAG: allophanate hydrolase subunit 1 [Arenicellales bacterium]